MVTGNVPAGRLVFLAVERHLNDLNEGAKRGLRFDDAAAAKIIRFFRDCAPFKLEPFQQFIVGNLFGWKGADGYRRFRTAYIEIGKGNGKSPLAAGIGIFGLLLDGEKEAEIYAAAVTKDQAGISFRDAVIMRGASDALSKRITERRNNLSVSSTNSFFRPISSEHRGLDGKRPHIVLIDEVHEHPSPIVVDKMRAGTKGRRQALIVEITNSGYDRETVCYYHHDYSRQLLEGTLQNDSWFAYPCQLDVCEDCRRKGREQPSCDNCDNWLDEDVWIKANPGLGVIIQKKYLREQITEALAMPAKENIVKRLNLCMWTQSETRAISADAWNACAGAELDGVPCGDPVRLREQWMRDLCGLICFGGLDLASTSDLASFVLFFPKQPGLAKARLIPFFFVPKTAVEHRSLKDRLPYDMWVKQGFLEQTSGNVIDYDYIRARIRELKGKYNLVEVGFDRWNATQIVTQLEGDGLTMVAQGQGFESMNMPTKELLRLVAGAEFSHGNNPVLAWQADNLVTTSDPAGSLKPVKPENPNSPKKIDGMVAFIDAIARQQANPNAVHATGPRISRL